MAGNWGNSFALLNEEDGASSRATAARAGQQAAKQRLPPGIGTSAADQRRGGVAGASRPAPAAAGANGTSGGSRMHPYGQGAPPVRGTTSNERERNRPFDFYRAFQKVYVDRSTGDVVLRFYKTDVVRVRLSGDVLLNSGGVYTQTVLASMNDALGAMGMALRPAGEDWVLVADDGTRTTYQDGMVIRARGTRDAGRARAVLTAYAGGALPPGLDAALPRAPAGAPTHPPAGIRTTGGGAGALRTAVGRPAGHAAHPTTMGHQHHHHQNVHHHPGAGPGPARPRATVEQQLAAAAAAVGYVPGGEDDLDDDEACVVCLEAARDVALVPCGHVVMCSVCCEDVVSHGSRECPICRVAIEDTVSMA